MKIKIYKKKLLLTKERTKALNIQLSVEFSYDFEQKKNRMLIHYLLNDIKVTILNASLFRYFNVESLSFYYITGSKTSFTVQ